LEKIAPTGDVTIKRVQIFLGNALNLEFMLQLYTTLSYSSFKLVLQIYNTKRLPYRIKRPATAAQLSIVLFFFHAPLRVTPLSITVVPATAEPHHHHRVIIQGDGRRILGVPAQSSNDKVMVSIAQSSNE
jgi:hypothetical protein